MATSPGGADDPAYTTPGAEGAAPTVLCPKGHSNAWNYKFCGQCGAPIGVVSWPSDDVEPPAENPVKSRTPFALGAVALVVVVAVSAVMIMMVRPSGSTDQQAGDSARTSTAGAPVANAGPKLCGQATILQAESINLTPEGLQVSAAFISPCGIDIESNSALVVTVAEGRRDIAAGTFDFSADPLTIDRGMPARRTLVFPPGMYWRTPDMLTEAPALLATRDGESDRTPVASSTSSTMVASGAAEPAYGSIDGVAKAVLNELRDGDLTEVRRNFVHAWVPQISSKKVGMEAAGRTWSNSEILREHLAMRQRFGGTRLVWSGHWTTFSSPDFWVTVVGPAHYYPEGANSWCDDNGFGVDDCFAKFLSPIFGVPGTTVYRR